MLGLLPALLCLALPWTAAAQGHLPCADGEQWDGGLCYPACNEDYEGVGPMCWQACYPPASDYALVCSSQDGLQEKNSYRRDASAIPIPEAPGDRNRCPDGQEWDQTAIRCYDRCKDGYYGLISTCWQRCPEGFTDDGALCRKDAVVVTKSSYGRGAGTTPSGCSASQQKDGALCYPGCAGGYYGVGPVCWQSCGSGYADHGATCYKNLFDWYFKKSYGRGAGSAPNDCGAGQQLDAGLCYGSCAAGYSGSGPVCWGTCPAGYKDDGALCRIDAQIVPKDSYDRGAGNVPPCDTRGRQYDTSYASSLSEYQHADTFTMLIASDPQLVRWSADNSPKCADDYCTLAKSRTANSDQVDAMNAIEHATWSAGAQAGAGSWPTNGSLQRGAGTPIAKPLGVIMNGDLTEYWHGYQEQLFRRYYEPGYANNAQHTLQLPIFPGLGNHDYSNNVGDCSDLTADSSHCAKRAVEYIKEMVYCDAVSNFINTLVQNFDEKSLAYSWNIGSYHFVQLHNYPTYARDEIGISSSIDWLKSDLAQATAAGRKIVLNFHDSEFGKYLDQVKFQDPAFLDAIKNANVVAVFTGHFHDINGYFGEIPGTNIPHFRSGASEYSTFLLAEFADDHINVGVIESHDGVPRFADPSNPAILDPKRAKYFPQGVQTNLHTVILK